MEGAEFSLPSIYPASSTVNKHHQSHACGPADGPIYILVSPRLSHLRSSFVGLLSVGLDQYDLCHHRTLCPKPHVFRLFSPLQSFLIL